MAAISSLPYAALRGASEWRPSSTAAVDSGAVVLTARPRRGSRSVARCVATAFLHPLPPRPSAKLDRGRRPLLSPPAPGLPFTAERRHHCRGHPHGAAGASISLPRSLLSQSRRRYSSLAGAFASADVPPTVAETKQNFLKSYKRPIPSIYSTVLQELLVQQHLMRYKRTYQYDPVFGLGFVTVYDQLMEGYPSNEDRDSIFKAYITALNEDPDQYRADAQKMEEWARSQNGNSLVDFSSRDGEIEAILKDISERAKGKGNFSYSRFFAVGLFRLLELANATEPTVLDKVVIDLSEHFRDLDVYRNILSKLVQAKELLKEYVDSDRKLTQLNYIGREKKKREERSETPKPNEAVTKFDGNLYSRRH
ncbi:hypothetical protein HU200_054643 [Digitaria exilis]|uniref:Uncharacterized protein n=1 Tax=Digitaria exilis TaxID=1010633 RepID=A0A835AKL0_9POAL|nr:hypothetical protein HU200_054643 [Digitaria exilis]